MLTPTTAKQDDLEAKQFQPDDGKSYIYVVWAWGLAGGAVAPEVNVNGKVLGSISRGKYYLVVSEPKEINFVSVIPDSAITYFACHPNRCRYLEARIGFGHLLFRELDTKKGGKIIKSSILIKKVVLE